MCKKYATIKVMRAITIMLVFITFSTVFSSHVVKAQEIVEYDLYSKENLYCFKYRGYLYRSEFVVYKHEGKEYPAYCLNRELDGVSLERGGYKVQIQNLIQNDLVWKAIKNGYPYKTYQELGCNNEMEAFTATKLAAYDMMYNYNLNDFVPINEAGTRVVAAIKNISNIARNSSEVKINPQIQILQVDKEWQIDNKEKQYISKTFKIVSNSDISDYTVHVKNEDIEGIKLENSKNDEVNVLNKNEEFKILIPIDQLNGKQQIQILANANARTYPIYYGKAPENLQNYAISGMEYETVETVLEEEIPQNTTKLTIQKVDAETKQPLSDFEFSVTNVKTKTIKKFITDSEGLIQISSILPGEYVIKEEKGQNDYVLNEEEIKANIIFNQENNLIIENHKKPVEIVIEQPVQEAVKLPRTGF